MLQKQLFQYFQKVALFSIKIITEMCFFHYSVFSLLYPIENL